MTMVMCPECHRLLCTVVNQIAYGNDHAILECRPCGKRYRMILEEVSDAEVDGWRIKEDEKMTDKKMLDVARQLSGPSHCCEADAWFYE